MGKTLAEQEKPFIDGLKAKTGRDFQEWLRVIAAGGVTERKALIKWLQEVQGLEYLPSHRLTHLFLENLELNGAKVRYGSSGRGGTLQYQSKEGAFEMWWEFAGGEALAIIDVPTPERWEAVTKIPKSRRDSILSFIGAQVVKDQTEGRGSFRIGDDVITIYAAR